MIELISLDNAQRWKEVINEFENKDFYHTFDYHKLSLLKNEKATLFTFSLNESKVAIPLIIRPIETQLGKDFYDVTSVYGYAGCLSLGVISEDFIMKFQQALQIYFNEHKIISVFSRLHPVFNDNQKKIVSELGNTYDIGTTVFIDLTLDLASQRRGFRKSTKSEINQLKKAGISVRKAENQNDINCFISIYTENMKRVQANEYYFFSKEYFYDFMESDDFESVILLAEQEGKIIAGAIFTFVGDVMQYHLAGTDEHHLKVTPMKLILDEARKLGTEKGLKYLHLGGGLGSKEDSLFKFKSGFSKNFLTFSIWKHIVNQEIYDALVKEKKGVNNTNFPKYRN